jgi:hypothetical protein
MTTAADINTAVPQVLPADGQTFIGPGLDNTRVWLQITPFGRVEIHVYRDGQFLASHFQAAPHG